MTTTLSLKTFILLSLLVPAAAAETRKDLSVPALAAAVNKTVLAAADRKIRLAVLPLKATESARYADRGCAAFLTEQLSSSLGAAGPKIRLFERTMLESVLKEQSLAAGGLIDKSEAVKIGELAPIDYILTGAITRLDGAVAVNLRLIDAVSGEIKTNLSESLELTPDLAALFEDVTARREAAVPGGEGDGPDCAKTWEPVKRLMEDVGTQDKVDRLAAAAMAVPFEGECGKVHFEVMGLLHRYRLGSRKYGEFLLGTLKKIAAPDEDDRAADIAGFLLEAGPRPLPGAWEEALRAAAASRRFYGWLDMLLSRYDGSDASLKLLREREGAILALADQKKLGRPVPLEPGKVFLGVLDALRSRYMGAYEKKDPRPLLDAYQAYGAKYAGGTDHELLKVLAGLHDETAGAGREQALGWFCARAAALPASRETADEVTDLMRRLFDARGEALKKDPSGGPAAAELKRLAGLCGPAVAAQVPFIVGRDYRLDVTAFCLENGIKGKDVPTLDELSRRLADGEDAEKGEAVRLLKALGPAAKPAERAAVKILSRTEDRYLQRDLIGLLGAMRTADPEAVRLMIEQLVGQESYLSDEAAPALAAAGEPAAAALKAEFAKLEESYRKVAILKVFRLRGRGAAKDLPWLKSVLAAAPDKYVKNAAEDAVEAVSK